MLTAFLQHYAALHLYNIYIYKVNLHLYIFRIFRWHPRQVRLNDRPDTTQLGWPQINPHLLAVTYVPRPAE
jgi:hypothetical protein